MDSLHRILLSQRQWRCSLSKTGVNADTNYRRETYRHPRKRRWFLDLHRHQLRCLSPGNGPVAQLLLEHIYLKISDHHDLDIIKMGFKWEIKRRTQYPDKRSLRAAYPQHRPPRPLWPRMECPERLRHRLSCCACGFFQWAWQDYLEAVLKVWHGVWIGSWCTCCFNVEAIHCASSIRNVVNPLQRTLIRVQGEERRVAPFLVGLPSYDNPWRFQELLYERRRGLVHLEWQSQ